jgi:N-hydroxyarylamine O-acetyltransferase
MAQQTERLSDDLRERVLLRLGLGAQPPLSLAGLDQVYAAWCCHVPFDNVRKMIHLHEQLPGPLPGDEPAEFFADWLADGTGGTCWAGNGALWALLASLGFDADRGIGTMVTSPTVPPNHGTVVVTLEGARYLVDASIVHGEPLYLDERAQTEIAHPAWGVRGRRQDGRWHIRWRPLHTPDGINCRIESLGATRQEFHDLHEQTRPWSPFNYELSARLNRGDTVVGAAFGKRVVLRDDGGVEEGPLSLEERTRLLVDQLGMSEQIAHRLPPGVPTPPRPGSRSAWNAPVQEPEVSVPQP